MRVNNPRQLAERLYHLIYPHSTFSNRNTWDRRAWINGVSELKKQIISEHTGE